jgi:hypothetical protein
LYYIFQQQVAGLRNVVQRSFIYNNKTHILKILPAPDSDDVKHYFVAGYTWPVTEIPDNYIPILLKFVESVCISSVAAKLSRLAGASTTGAVGIYGNLSNYIQMGKDRKKEAEEMALTQSLIEGPVL